MRRLLVTVTDLLLVLFALVASPRDARAHAFEVRDDGWEGGSEFLSLARDELGADHVVPVAELNWSHLQPTDGVLLIHPERTVSSEHLAAFMSAGGRVGILDDFGAGDRTMARFGIQKALPPIHPLQALRDNPELAMAEPVAEGPPGSAAGIHPSVAGVDRVVTNHPTALRSAELTPVLKIRSADGADAIIAYAGEPKSATARAAPGKLLAMSDPSVLINQMLRYPGNRAFATGLVRYLGRYGDRDRGKLYVLTNDFSESGSFGSASLRSALETRVEDLRSTVRQLAAEGFSGQLGWALGTVLAAGLCVVAARACGKRRPTALPRFTQGPPLAAQGGPVGRAAVLSAPSTPPALGMLELKSLLEDRLAAHSGRFGGAGRSSFGTMVQAIERDEALDESSRRALKEMRRDMAKAETQVVRGRTRGVRSADVERAAKTVARVLAVVDASTAKRSAS